MHTLTKEYISNEMTKQDTMPAANSNKRDIVQEESCRSTKNKTMTKAKNIKIVRKILKKKQKQASQQIFSPQITQYSLDRCLLIINKTWLNINGRYGSEVHVVTNERMTNGQTMCAFFPRKSDVHNQRMIVVKSPNKIRNSPFSHYPRVEF